MLQQMRAIEEYSNGLNPIYYLAKENRCLYPFYEAYTQRIGIKDMSMERK